MWERFFDWLARKLLGADKPESEEEIQARARKTLGIPERAPPINATTHWLNTGLPSGRFDVPIEPYASAEGLELPERSREEIALANEYFGVPTERPISGPELDHYMYGENIGDVEGLVDMENPYADLPVAERASERIFDEADAFKTVTADDLLAQDSEDEQ